MISDHSLYDALKDRVRQGKALYPFFLSFCGFRGSKEGEEDVLMFPSSSFTLSFLITCAYQHLAGGHRFGELEVIMDNKIGWFLPSWSLWSGWQVRPFF